MWWDVGEHILAGQSIGPETGVNQWRKVEPLLGQASMEGIRKSPWKFLAYTPGLAWRLFVADPSWWIPRWGDTSSVSFKLETPPFFGPTASSYRWRKDLEEINRTLWPIICWLAIVGLALGFLSPQRRLILSFAWVPIGYLLLSAAVEALRRRRLQCAGHTLYRRPRNAPAGLALHESAARHSESPAAGF